ncbi:hypothetical protein AB0G15_33170 [Streptosporangium sp. NPDC023825]|uniref:hypothetical protein n=1 Tax=Streptosporangium sp. NPDC023825 TaxID=3154909 RepID=UPI0034216A4E
MNRSKIRERFACQGVAGGEVVVASAFHHPGRGSVGCPAAPVLGAALTRRGLRVRYAPLTAHPESRPAVHVPPDIRLEPRSDTRRDDRWYAPVTGRADGAFPDDGHLFAVSWLDRHGRATGLAAAAHPDDRAAVEAAGQEVWRWSDVMRSRRVLLAGTRPVCPGALGALETALGVTRGGAGGGPVFAYGPVTDAPHHAEELARAGIGTVTGLDTLPEHAAVVFPAHGVPPVLRAEAAARGLAVVDATCPLVSAAHAEVARFTERGDLTVVIGRPGDAVVPGILGQAPETTVLVETAADVARLRPADPMAVSYLIQPGIPVERALPVVAALRARFPGLRGPDPDDFCYHASDRATSVASVAAAGDLLLVAAGPGCPDARHVIGLAGDSGVLSRVVTGVSDLCPSLLREAGTVALTGARSAPPGLVDEILTVLSGLGPLNVVDRRVTSEVVTGEVVTGRERVVTGRERERV